MAFWRQLLQRRPFRLCSRLPWILCLSVCVASLNRPGGNATGVSMYTPQLVAKRFELLTELTPGGGTIAILLNPTNPNAHAISSDSEAAAKSLGREFHILKASTDQEIAIAFDEI